MAVNKEMSDIKIVIDGFLSGDSTYYRIIKNKITQYIYHQNFGTTSDRDELISELMEILYENFRNHKFRGDSLSALNVYIFQIIKFRINRILRRTERLLYSDETFEYIKAENVDTAKEFGNKELIHKIYNLLDGKCAELLKLKFLECWLDQEIADHFQQTKNATSTAISRCLQKVRQFDFVKELM